MVSSSFHFQNVHPLEFKKWALAHSTFKMCTLCNSKNGHKLESFSKCAPSGIQKMGSSSFQFQNVHPLAFKKIGSSSNHFQNLHPLEFKKLGLAHSTFKMCTLCNSKNGHKLESFSKCAPSGIQKMDSSSFHFQNMQPL